MFASPDNAAQAIYAIAKVMESNALLAIFGPDAKELIFSGDPVQDGAGLDEFRARYDQMRPCVVMSFDFENWRWLSIC